MLLISLYSSHMHSVPFKYIYYIYIYCCYIPLSPCLLLLPLGSYLCLSRVVPFLPDVLCSSLFSRWWMMLCLSQHLCITFPILCMSKMQRGRRKGGLQKDCEDEMRGMLVPERDKKKRKKGKGRASSWLNAVVSGGNQLAGSMPLARYPSRLGTGSFTANKWPREAQLFPVFPTAKAQQSQKND